MGNDGTDPSLWCEIKVCASNSVSPRQVGVPGMEAPITTQQEVVTAHLVVFTAPQEGAQGLGSPSYQSGSVVRRHWSLNCFEALAHKDC